MQGIPSSYDQYFTVNPNLEHEVNTELKKNECVITRQRWIEDGFYYAFPEYIEDDCVNDMIEEGSLTPSRNIYKERF